MKISDSIYCYFDPDRKWKVNYENFKTVKIFYEILIIYAFFSTMQAVVDRMSEGELRRCLRAAAIAEPEVMRNFIIGQHRVEPVIGDPGSSNSNVPGCSCGKCIVFTDPRMNICCGQRPCITSKTEFKNLCLRHDVLEVANILNWSYQFNQEPSFRNSTFRNQAYRNFILWQHGRLGARRRVPVPSCVCKTVRDRFPESNGLYRGYHSANSDSE